MNVNKVKTARLRVRRTALALAITAGFAVSGQLYAQSTSGSIVGSAPVSAGETVLVKGASGFEREVEVDAKGRYAATSLPLGEYVVSLKQNGQTLDSRQKISLRAGSATEVDFLSKEQAKELGAVTVVGNSQPAIDVTSSDVHTVITADQLAKLPLARSAEAIALLAPGVTPGYSGFSGPLGNRLDSFAGSSVTENAYYVNGFNTTDPLSGFGGITLPYGAIDQQEILNGGYDARFGRSDGGVISQNGKRGTNEWHFGAQLLFTPEWGNGNQHNTYYVNGASAGKIYRDNNQSKSENFTESAYLGGPLIKDKLFFFLAAEQTRTLGNSIGSISSPYNTKYSYNDPKWYAKIDWNINDSNILEWTGVSNKHSYQGNNYSFDYDNRSTGGFYSSDTSTATKANINIIKYTSYITDDLTLTAQYGKQKIRYFTAVPGAQSTDPYVGNPDREDPAITGGAPITGNNTILTLNNPSHYSINRNLRVDLSYRIGDHTIGVGIDNQDSHDVNDGTSTQGPGYAWIYGQGDADINISDSPYVGPPGGDGYYVDKYIYNTAASVRVKQRAWYIEDNWQINDRLVANIGLRDDSFTNYNPDGKAFLRLRKPQWAPRLGVSWDVNGDSTFKVFANAGRYYLAMPASVALRAAAGSLYTDEYYTYTGIDPSTGIPTGLTPIASETGGAVSTNNEYGQQPDPKTVAASSIKSEYQDEYVFGFEHSLNWLDTSWVYGAKGQIRKLRNILDDICDPDTVYNKAISLGLDVDASAMNGCYLSNPGRANTYRLLNNSGGYDSVTVTKDDYGDPIAKRNYYGMELFLEHPFDGKWYGKISYVWSHSLGDTEGQVRSDIGQKDVSATVDWDFGKLMEYSGGDLANDRTHVLKLYGSYQLTPEWMVSGNLALMSGTPKNCLGFYGPDESNPIGYSSEYHWCGGVRSRPGDAGRTPWQHILSLNAEYRPAFAEHKLAFNIMVYNLLNESVPTSYAPNMGYKDSVYSSYDRVNYWSTPRYLRFGITYDF